MTVKLTKTKSTRWLGNGFGTSSAEWSLASDPQWSISSLNGRWAANHPDGTRLRADSRAILLQKLERHLERTAA